VATIPIHFPELVPLLALVLAAALLYSSGGHAGASAYLAIFGLYALAPATMRPTVLVMNIAVATIGSARFIRARAVPWALLGPLCLGSLPAAFVGGGLKVAPGTYLALLGGTLLCAALFLWIRPKRPTVRRPPPPAALVGIGTALGFLAGLTGIGGGIFLSPLLMLTGWEEPRRTSGAAAVFILANSVLGLAGQLASLAHIPRAAAWLAGTAVAGGLAGSWLGVNRLRPLALRRVHAVILVVSGAKLLVEGLRLL
jgi:uncharacterized membrane protein YfcA